MPDFGALGTLIALAVLTEATVQIFFKDTPSPISTYISSLDDEKSQTVLRRLSAIIGVVYAFNMGVDVFTILGYQSNLPYVGKIASGLIASRGSNYIHDSLGNLINKNREPII
ncbi:MAG: hypothetical protein ACOY3J_10660 [Bacillota bacterium]|uniref:Uncharacterized protein n=1 Tax=Thermanaerosceptrum fracticalcis TaxID=1712410 RepID=A0A7G6DZ77_THEFR|nr:hypothetical protein [Thermanaerosceptrum fracticalcis]QNB45131.1 hypothetical protein BR63_01615 [Thermanaerosceptrum fracticalcis]